MDDKIAHIISDDDPSFTINPDDRTIINNSGKTVLVQYDHDSEEFTFEIPRYVDGHDMSESTSITISYINKGTLQKEVSTGLYEAIKVRISPTNPNRLLFSWILSQNTTLYVGTLSFAIRFACVDPNGVIKYQWGTKVCTGIQVVETMNNAPELAPEIIDIVSQWKNKVLNEIVDVQQTVYSEEPSSVQQLTISMSNGENRQFFIYNGDDGEQGPEGPEGPEGPPGPKGETGDPFTIAKIYSSVSEMEEDFGNEEIKVGAMCLIDTGDVEDPDNAKLYIKTETNFSYITDLSGAQGIKGEKGDKGDKGDTGEEGPQGPTGERGATFTPTVSDTGDLVWSNDGLLANPETVNIRGPRGVQGPPGQKGDKGDTPIFEIDKATGHLWVYYPVS